MRGQVVSDVNRFFPITSTELSYVCDCRSIQRPEGVLIECLYPFFQPNFDAIQQQIVLPKEILLLDLGIEPRVVAFSYAHVGPQRDA
jgi:hypothetical protein